MEPRGQVAPVTGGGRGLGRAFVLAIASGKADILPGSYIDITHDLDDPIARADELRRGDLLRLRRTRR